MFGESPSQGAGNALGELLDTPPEVFAARAEATELRGTAWAAACSTTGAAKRANTTGGASVAGATGAAGAAGAGAVGTACATGGAGHAVPHGPAVGASPRLASWFVEMLRGDSVTLTRAGEQEEQQLGRALQRALAGPQRGGPAPSRTEFRGRFLHELGIVDCGGLRCVPLHGELVRRLPEELLGDPRVSAARLPPGRALAGAALLRAKGVVEELLRACGPAAFKIGITCSPLARWRAYEREGYAQMHLLHATEEPGAVQMLEAALIDAFQARAGCRNIARGGEGPVGRGPYFCYLALAPCGAGVGLHKRSRVERAAAPQGLR